MALKSDTEKLKELCRLGDEHFADELPSYSYVPAWPQVEDAITRECALVAVNGNDEAIGLISVVVLDGDSAAYVSHLLVHPDHRDAGLGKQLMNEAERMAERLGAHRVALFAPNSTIRFYEPLGYRAVGMTMEKKL